MRASMRKYATTVVGRFFPSQTVSSCLSGQFLAIISYSEVQNMLHDEIWAK